MISLSQQRRKFIKELVVLSILCGTDLNKIFANAHLDNDIVADPAELNRAYQQFLRHSYNSGSIYNFSDAGQQANYERVLKLLSVGLSPGFQTLGVKNKISQLQKADTSRNKLISAEDQKRIYQGIHLAEPLDLAFNAAFFAMASTGILVKTTSKALTLINPAYKVALDMPKWAKITAAITGGLINLRREAKDFSEILAYNTSGGLEILKTVVFDRYLKQSEFKFEANLKNFPFLINSPPDKNQLAFKINQTPDRDIRNLTSWIAEKLENGPTLAKEDELPIFIEGWVKKLAEVQKTQLLSVIEAQKKSDEETLKREREKGALLDSLNSFVGKLIFSQLAAPKEAELLSMITSSGTQILLAGSIGTMGIAAIGVNLATVLLSQSNGQQFEKTVLTALAEIQEQLRLVTEKLDEVYKTEIRILFKLNEILDELHKIDIKLDDRFNEIREVERLTYQAIQQNEINSIKATFNERNLRLSAALKRNDINAFRTSLQDIREIILGKLAIGFTGYVNTEMTGFLLKKQILMEAKYRYNICLYNSIGLLSGLAQYDPVIDIGKNNMTIVHPIEFYNGSSTIIDWLIVSDLPLEESKTMASELLNAATTNIQTINDLAALRIIKTKVNQYLQVKDAYLFELYTELTRYEQELVSQLGNVLEAPRLSTEQIDFTGKLKPQTQTDPQVFMENKNDYPMFNVLCDMNLLEIRTNNIRPYTNDIYLGLFRDDQKDGRETVQPEMKVGAIIGSKSNILIFREVTLSASIPVKFNIQIGYTRNVRAAAYQHEDYEWTSMGREHDYSTYKVRRRFTKSVTETIIQSDWKHLLTSALSEANLEPQSVIPNIDDISFNDFLVLVAENWVRQNKQRITHDLIPMCSDFLFSKFNGTGIALMVLSKLNKIINSNHHLHISTFDGEISYIPYSVDYTSEIFTNNDVCDVLQWVGKADFDANEKDIFSRIRALYSIASPVSNPEFFLNDTTGKKIKLNPTFFSDMAIVFLNEKIQKTANKCLDITRDIPDSTGEPYLIKAKEKITWYLQNRS
jgi:hypothetical protein